MPLWISDTFLFVVRVLLAWPFLKSGIIKLQDWESTLYLFEYEYHVPFLPFKAAAYLATGIELLLPFTLLLGLFVRLSAFGLFVFNAIAVLSYPTLWKMGFWDHQLWGWQALILVVFGGGTWSLIHSRLPTAKEETTNPTDP